MTPFEKAGYTKDTKFRVIRDIWGLKKDDIVTLDLDDGSYLLRFKTEDGRWIWSHLPNMVHQNDYEYLVVYVEEDK